MLKANYSNTNSDRLNILNTELCEVERVSPIAQYARIKFHRDLPFAY